MRDSLDLQCASRHRPYGGLPQSILVETPKNRILPPRITSGFLQERLKPRSSGAAHRISPQVFCKRRPVSLAPVSGKHDRTFRPATRKPKLFEAPIGTTTSFRMARDIADKALK